MEDDRDKELILELASKVCRASKPCYVCRDMVERLIDATGLHKRTLVTSYTVAGESHKVTTTYYRSNKE